MAQVKTRTKLLVAFLAVALGSAVVGGLSLRATGQLAGATRNLTDHQLQSLSALEGVEAGVLAMRLWTSKALTAASLKQDDRVELFWGSREAARQATEAAMKRFAALEHAPAVDGEWKKLEAGYAQYLAGSEPVWKALREVKGAEADALQDTIADQIQAELMDPLKMLSALVRNEAQLVGKDALAVSTRATRAIWAGMLATLAAAAALGTALAFSVTRPIVQVIAEALRLRRAVEEGRITERGDPARFPQEFRPVVEGLNATMEAFTRPIQLTAGYIDRIARGDVPPPIADGWQGDFDGIREDLNRCIRAVGALVDDAKGLAAAAVAGDLGRRADPARHEGDFRRVIEGVNGTLDAVLVPVNAATGALTRLAGRDLTARVEGAFQGDHARMQQAVNATAEALHAALAQVAEAVGQVSRAAGQIASSSQAVASGASEQASSLEETSASLESMTAMTRTAAESAAQAATLAQAAREAAVKGGDAMQGMRGAMGRIQSAAEGTAAIIKEVNEIAFQTNLLALNAAVEAARAGEAGRGFAVVAEEVRSLALRSKEAAARTEGLIQGSVREAVEGERAAARVDRELTSIAGGVAKVNDLLAELASGAREQAAGIEQVAKAVSQLDGVTQQNAASAEESSSAAAELSGQSEELASMVESFRVDDGDAGPSLALPPAAEVRVALPA